MFFERANKINKPLVRPTKKKREKTQINKIKTESGEITTDTAEIQKKKKKKKTTIREYCKQLYTNKVDDLEEIGDFLQTYSQTKLNQEEIDNLNRPICTYQ